MIDGDRWRRLDLLVGVQQDTRISLLQPDVGAFDWRLHRNPAHDLLQRLTGQDVHVAEVKIGNVREHQAMIKVMAGGVIEMLPATCCVMLVPLMVAS